MAEFSWPSTLTRKPEFGAQIDRAHLLAPDFCAPLNEAGGKRAFDLAGLNNGLLSVADVPVWKPDPRWGGARVRAVNTSGHGIDFGDSSRFVPASGGFTVILSYRKTDGTLRNSSGFGVYTAGLNDRCGAHMPWSDGTVYWDFGGATEGTTRVSVASLTFGDDIWAFTTGARGMEIWQNGIKRASNAANPTRTVSTASWVLFGGDAQQVPDLAESAFFYAYRRQLTAGQIQEITAHPFAFLIPVGLSRHRLVSVVLAPSIALPAIASGAGAFTPTVAAEPAVTTSTLASAAQAFAPTVVGGLLVLAPPPIGSAAAVRSPTVTMVLAAPSIGAGSVVRTPALILRVAAPTVASAALVLAPSTTGGIVAHELPFVGIIPRLCRPFSLPHADVYAAPGDPALALPVVYGDFGTGGGPGGPLPTVLIRRDPPLYAAAGHPVLGIDRVYVAGVEQRTGFTVVASVDVEGQGAVATIAFATTPAGIVTWRGRGIVDADGALIENALDQLRHALLTYGGFVAGDLDPTAWAEARMAVDRQRYRTAWLLAATTAIQDWLTEALFNVMGFWRVTGAGHLAPGVDDGQAVPASDIAAALVASRDCLDGDDGVSFTLDKRAIVNRVAAYYQWSYAAAAAASRYLLEDPVSVDAYGPIAKALTFRGLRREADVDRVAALLLLRQSARTRVEGGVVRLTGLGGGFAHLATGDFVTVTWPYGPTREGGGAYVEQLCRVVACSVEASRGGAVTLAATHVGPGTLALPEVAVGGLLEEMLILDSDINNPWYGPTEVWFRNADQFTNLHLTAALGFSPRSVVWGAIDNTFVIPGASGYYVFRLTRAAGVPYAPGETAAVILLRVDPLPAAPIAVGTVTGSSVSRGYWAMPVVEFGLPSGAPFRQWRPGWGIAYNWANVNANGWPSFDALTWHPLYEVKNVSTVAVGRESRSGYVRSLAFYPGAGDVQLSANLEVIELGSIYEAGVSTSGHHEAWRLNPALAGAAGGQSLERQWFLGVTLGAGPVQLTELNVELLAYDDGQPYPLGMTQEQWGQLYQPVYPTYVGVGDSVGYAGGLFNVTTGQVLWTDAALVQTRTGVREMHRIVPAVGRWTSTIDVRISNAVLRFPAPQMFRADRWAASTLRRPINCPRHNWINEPDGTQASDVFIVAAELPIALPEGSTVYAASSAWASGPLAGAPLVATQAQPYSGQAFGPPLNEARPIALGTVAGYVQDLLFIPQPDDFATLIDPTAWYTPVGPLETYPRHPIVWALVVGGGMADFPTSIGYRILDFRLFHYDDDPTQTRCFLSVDRSQFWGEHLAAWIIDGTGRVVATLADWNTTLEPYFVAGTRDHVVWWALVWTSYVGYYGEPYFEGPLLAIDYYVTQISTGVTKLFFRSSGYTGETIDRQHNERMNWAFWRHGFVGLTGADRLFALSEEEKVVVGAWAADGTPTLELTLIDRHPQGYQDQYGNELFSNPDDWYSSVPADPAFPTGLGEAYHLADPPPEAAWALDLLMTYNAANGFGGPSRGSAAGRIAVHVIEATGG